MKVKNGLTIQYEQVLKKIIKVNYLSWSSNFHNLIFLKSNIMKIFEGQSILNFIRELPNDEDFCVNFWLYVYVWK